MEMQIGESAVQYGSVDVHTCEEDGNYVVCYHFNEDGEPYCQGYGSLGFLAKDVGDKIASLAKENPFIKVETKEAGLSKLGEEDAKKLEREILHRVQEKLPESKQPTIEFLLT